ncbi:endonuclease [Yeosuana marina]|uniref:endonuclease n=1 Tax=Yeosuana marina TaxID=1565536 RepID=UPI0030C84229
MKRTLLFITLLVPLFFTGLLAAQIPDGYYAPAEGYAGDALKYALNQIVDGQVEFPYTSTSTDVWDILKETDRDPNNPDNVILIYSGVSVNAAQEYNSGNGWTREHVWAKSRGDFGTSTGPGTDIHHLRPLDNATNTIRNNRGFDNCMSCAEVYDQWSNDTGSQIDTNDWSFEPRDAVKGDVARMLFYMAVRYEGYDGYPDLELSESILDQGDKSPLHGKLSTLLQWNRDDPVDGWEENRNDIIYYNYQHNRNPFIDHPELAEYLWGNNIGMVWPEGLHVADISALNILVYPNPAKDHLAIYGIRHSVEVDIYDPLGRAVLKIENVHDKDRIDVSRLHGLYVLRVVSGSKFISKKVVID